MPLACHVRRLTRLGDSRQASIPERLHRKLVPCDVTSDGNIDCATKYITTLATKSFRHPLSPTELRNLTDIYVKARETFGFSDSIDVVTRSILQAPQTFYVHEVGESDSRLPANLLRVTSYEMASRLSYLLWDSLPDEALLDVAAQNKLGSMADIQTVVTRMLADPRARAKFVRFSSAWLELDGTAKHVSIDEAVKDPAIYPLDNADLRKAVRREIEEFVGRVWDRGGSVEELFKSTDAYVNGPLAKLYGVPNGPTSAADWRWVTLPADQRAGLPTRAAFLLIYANPDIPSPIRRGAAILRDFMCMSFPPPPPAANDVKIAASTDAQGRPLAIRDVVNAKTIQDTQCKGCHTRINPAGFPLGNFDAIGQWHAQESGKTAAGKPYTAPIDAGGELVGSDVAGAFDGPVALSAKLAASRNVKDCIASRFWTSAFGRPGVEEEKTSIAYVQGQLAASGKVTDALVGLTTSPAFRYIKKVGQ